MALERHRPEPLAHAPLPHHAAGPRRGLVEVVGRTGGAVAEDEVLGDAAAEGHAQAVLDVLLATASGAPRASSG